MRNLYLIACLFICMHVSAQKNQFDKLDSKIFNELCKSNRDNNVVFSPLSANTSLILFLNCIEPESAEKVLSELELDSYTLTDINKYYRSVTDNVDCHGETFDANICNSIWLQNGYTFKNNNLLDLKCVDYSNIDFTSKNGIDAINNWISDKTHNQINSFYTDPQFDKIIEIINTIYFKNSWSPWFNSEYTIKDIFTNRNGSTSPVEMMCGMKHGAYSKYDKYVKAVIDFGGYKEITYDRYISYSITFIMPNDVDNFNVENLYDYLNKDKYQKYPDIYLQLPKFTYKSEKINIGDVIDKTLNCTSFGRYYNYSQICDCDKYLMPKLYQQTALSIDEKGIEASAVTSHSGSDGYHEIEDVKLDRPFYFAIRENESNEVLFLGYIGNLGNSSYNTIKTLENNNTDNPTIYNINGIKCNSIRNKGFYIVNGKKYYR